MENESSDWKKIQLIEETIYGSIYGDIQQISKYLPNLKSMISPDIRHVSNQFNLCEDSKLQETEKMYSLGMLNGHLCVNARTCLAHTECDSSYTVISVPMQDFSGYKDLDANFHFLLSEQLTMVLTMVPNVAFLYSGYMLTQHQQLNLDS